MPWFYYLGRVLVRTALFLLTRCHVKGRENIPRQGPVLVVANHLNLADPPLIAIAVGRKAIFMAKQELFRSRFTGYFVGSFGSFPVHRGQLDRKALRQAQRVLAEGSVLIMFPESSRSQNAQLQPPFPGSALIALRSGAPILPVGIAGTEKLRRTTWWLRRPEITISVGRPFHLPTVNGKLSKSELAQASDFMIRRVAELLPVQYRGDYGDTGEIDGNQD